VGLRAPRAIRWLLWQPNELGLARAFVSGDLELDGDPVASLRELRERVLARTGRLASVRTLATLWSAAARIDAIGPPPPVPAEEARLGGRRHTHGRDASAIEHHYDVGNDFYRLVLGPEMTYSCARFETPDSTLDEAQRAKHDLICRKLGLDVPGGGVRLLDVGCGWGTLAIHAALEYDAVAVGVTVSPSQYAYAHQRVKALGLEGRVEIRLQDYRDLAGETFDAISSVGMFEHVGAERMAAYFTTLSDLLVPQGRLLNHAISKPGGRAMTRRGFMNRYVFPDGHLLDVAQVVQAMEQCGIEVRDVECLREHYAETLAAWLDNLTRTWDDASALVGEPRARVWRLYMAASQNAFAAGALSLHQVLGVRADVHGTSGMPRNRAAWERLGAGLSGAEPQLTPDC
jgi:cyclopropane-fatty-acyl-phospholipid synthase